MPADIPDISLFNESEQEIPLTKDQARSALSLVAENESCSFNFVEIVYVDEQQIVRINKEHLDREYVTDIITFRYDEESFQKNIEVTLFCCAPRIYEQAQEFGQSPDREFMRILIHGLLHLCGYDDKSEQSKQEMTKRENFYLDLLTA